MARSGQITVTTAGTAVRGDDQAGSWFVLKAHPDNTDTVWIGEVSEDVSSSNGFPLGPSQAVELGLSNLRHIWCDADVDGEKVCWLLIE